MIGNDKDITIHLNHGLNDYSIEFIQQIEKALDETLGSLGFSRNSSTKSGDKVKLSYYQFGTSPV